MSYVQQVGCNSLWSVHWSHVTEPFAYISEVGETYRVEDVDDGPLGSRRTFAAAVALVERHAAKIEEEQAAHNARVSAIIAAMDGPATEDLAQFEQITTEN